MKAAKNLDELWEQQAQSHAKLMDDPKWLHQAKELSNTAGKMISIIKTKLAACELAGVEADIPQLGVYRGKPTSTSACRRPLMATR